MIERIRGINARPVIFSASPINNGSTMAKLDGDQRLHEYAAALKELAAREKLPYADQFHALIDVWGNNKSQELLANALVLVKPLAQDDSLVGVEHLRAFLKAQEKNPVQPVSMQGDPVHPGPAGQLMMAAALLKELGADGFVSSVSLDSNGKLLEAKDCEVEQIKAAGGKIEFDRLDQRLPLPVPDEARAVVAFYPTILELSQYMLRVTGLNSGTYTLKINGVVAAAVTAKELGTGLNLTALGAPAAAKEADPIAAQGRNILAAVAAKEALVGQWRGLSQKAHAQGAAAELSDQLSALTPKVEEADGKIRDAARPQKLHFEISPAP